MKIRVLSCADEIDDLLANERIVHCAFRPGTKEIFRIAENCPQLEAVQIPKSYMGTVASSVKQFLAIRKIRLIEGDVQGHRKDINKYYEVPERLIQKIQEMKKNGVPDKVIYEDVKKLYLLRPETAAYVVEKVEVEK